MSNNSGGLRDEAFKTFVDSLFDFSEHGNDLPNEEYKDEKDQTDEEEINHEDLDAMKYLSENKSEDVKANNQSEDQNDGQITDTMEDASEGVKANDQKDTKEDDGWMTSYVKVLTQHWEHLIQDSEPNLDHQQQTLQLWKSNLLSSKAGVMEVPTDLEPEAKVIQDLEIAIGLALAEAEAEAEAEITEEMTSEPEMIEAESKPDETMEVKPESVEITAVLEMTEAEPDAVAEVIPDESLEAKPEAGSLEEARATDIEMTEAQPEAEAEIIQIETMEVKLEAEVVEVQIDIETKEPLEVKLESVERTDEHWK